MNRIYYVLIFIIITIVLATNIEARGGRGGGGSRSSGSRSSSSRSSGSGGGGFWGSLFGGSSSSSRISSSHLPPSSSSSNWKPSQYTSYNPYSHYHHTDNSFGSSPSKSSGPFQHTSYNSNPYYPHTVNYDNIFRSSLRKAADSTDYLSGFMAGNLLSDDNKMTDRSDSGFTHPRLSVMANIEPESTTTAKMTTNMETHTNEWLNVLNELNAANDLTSLESYLGRISKIDFTKAFGSASIAGTWVTTPGTTESLVVTPSSTSEMPTSSTELPSFNTESSTTILELTSTTVQKQSTADNKENAVDTHIYNDDLLSSSMTSVAEVVPETTESLLSNDHKMTDRFDSGFTHPRLSVMANIEPKSTTTAKMTTNMETHTNEWLNVLNELNAANDLTSLESYLGRISKIDFTKAFGSASIAGTLVTTPSTTESIVVTPSEMPTSSTELPSFTTESSTTILELTSTTVQKQSTADNKENAVDTHIYNDDLLSSSMTSVAEIVRATTESTQEANLDISTPYGVICSPIIYNEVNEFGVNVTIERLACYPALEPVAP